MVGVGAVVGEGIAVEVATGASEGVGAFVGAEMDGIESVGSIKVGIGTTTGDPAGPRVCSWAAGSAQQESRSRQSSRERILTMERLFLDGISLSLPYMFEGSVNSEKKHMYLFPICLGALQRKLWGPWKSPQASFPTKKEAPVKQVLLSAFRNFHSSFAPKAWAGSHAGNP